MASRRKPANVDVAMVIDGLLCAWPAHRLYAARLTPGSPVRAAAILPLDGRSAAPVPPDARARDPRLVRGTGPAAGLPPDDRPVRGPRVRGDGPADAGGPRRRSTGSASWPGSRRSSRSRPRRRPTSCASGRASATTGAAMNLWRRRADHRRATTAAGCRPTSRRLEALPGVGPYTARAVAAIAFGIPVGAVDTNVRRVLGRIVRRRSARRSTAPGVQALADASVPPDRPGRLDPRAHGPRGDALPRRAGPLRDRARHDLVPLRVDRAARSPARRPRAPTPPRAPERPSRSRRPPAGCAAACSTASRGAPATRGSRSRRRSASTTARRCDARRSTAWPATASSSSTRRTARAARCRMD